MDCGFHRVTKLSAKAAASFSPLAPNRLLKPLTALLLPAGANKCAARNSMRRQLETKE
jgi:hypothetical protein